MSSRARASKRPSRSALPTSWSTSRSRARPRTRRRARSARPSKGRRVVQRRNRSRVDRVLGSRAGASGPRRRRSRGAHRPAEARCRRDRGRAIGDHRGDPLVPRRPERVLPDPVPGRALRGGAAGTRDLRRRGGDPGAPGTTIRDFWRVTYRPANTVVAIAGDLGHDRAVDLVANAFGSGNGAVPGSRPPRAACRPPRDARQARHDPGPAVHRGAGAPPRPSGQLDPRGAQRDPRRRDEQPPLPVGA